jgi:hypothetical protein
MGGLENWIIRNATSGVERIVMNEFKLCYVDDCWAYFTTQELSKQIGDDWDDAPYEHNAGSPYEPYRDGETWQILKVAFDGAFTLPCDGYTNTPWSVTQINDGIVPWLIPWQDRATLAEFIEFVEKYDGSVYHKQMGLRRVFASE